MTGWPRYGSECLRRLVCNSAMRGLHRRYCCMHIAGKIVADATSGHYIQRSIQSHFVIPSSCRAASQSSMVDCNARPAADVCGTIPHELGPVHRVMIATAVRKNLADAYPLPYVVSPEAEGSSSCELEASFLIDDGRYESVSSWRWFQSCRCQRATA